MKKNDFLTDLSNLNFALEGITVQSIKIQNSDGTLISDTAVSRPTDLLTDIDFTGCQFKECSFDSCNLSSSMEIVNDTPVVLLPWNSGSPDMSSALTEKMLIDRNTLTVRMDYQPEVDELALDKEINELNKLSSERLSALKDTIFKKAKTLSEKHTKLTEMVNPLQIKGRHWVTAVWLLPMERNKQQKKL